MFSKCRYLSRAQAIRGSLCAISFEKQAVEACDGKTLVRLSSSYTYPTGQKELDTICKSNDKTFAYKHDQDRKQLFDRLRYLGENIKIKKHCLKDGGPFEMPRRFYISHSSNHLNYLSSLSRESTSSNFWVPSRNEHTDTNVGFLSSMQHLLYEEDKAKSTSDAEPERIPDKTDLKYLLMGCDTIQDVLDLIEPKLDRGELNIKHYISILQTLQVIVYKRVHSQFPWLIEDNIARTSVVMRLNNIDIKEFSELEQNPKFQKLKEKLVASLEEMTPTEFVVCFSSLIRLGTPHTSSTIVNFMAKVDDIPAQEFGIFELHMLSVCLKALNRPDVLVLKYVYPGLKSFIESGKSVPNDRKVLFSLLFLGHSERADADVMIWVSQNVLKIIKESDLLNSYLVTILMGFCKNIALFFKTLPRSEYKCRVKSPEKHEELFSYFKELTDIAIIKVIELQESLTPLAVSQITARAFSMQICHLPWADVVRQRSLDLVLDPNLSFVQLAPALHGLTLFEMDAETVQKVENRILYSIEDINFSSLSYVLEYLIVHRTNNKFLLEKCEKEITKCLSTLLSNRALSYVLYSFLSIYPSDNDSFHAAFQSEHTKITTWSFQHSGILKYLLNQKSWLPISTDLLDRVAQKVAWCGRHECFRIVSWAANWNSMKQNLQDSDQMDAKLAGVIQDFEMEVCKRYYGVLNEASCISYLVHLTKHVMKISSHMIFTKDFVNAFESLLEKDHLDTWALEELVKTIKNMDLSRDSFSVDVIDYLLDSLSTLEADAVTEAWFNNLLKFFSFWFCSGPDEETNKIRGKLQDVLQSRADQFLKGRNDLTKLMNLEHLCCLGAFPEAALMDMLNVDALTRLDELIQENDDDDSRKKVYQIVVNINRCVAIDKPELKIPWFMGSYVEDHNVEYSKYLRLRDWQRKIEEVKMAVGEDNIGPVNKVLEYGYTGTIVCLMDQNDKLVPYSNHRFKFAKEHNLQRVIIDIIFKRRSRHRTKKHYKLQRQHLQKLGYKLIEFSAHELNSIALSRFHDRAQYIRGKVLGKPSPLGQHQSEPERKKKEFKPLVLSKDRRELYDFDVTSDDYQEESSAVS